MTERGESPPDIRREYSFEEGVQEVLRLVREKLANQNVVAVAVNSTGMIDIGKTSLVARLYSELAHKEAQEIVDVEQVTDSGPISRMREVKTLQDLYGTELKLVVFFSTEVGKHSKHRDLIDAVLQTNTAKEGIAGLEKVDIWILLDRPDRRAPPDYLGDVHICNEKAINDPTKIK